MTRSIYRTDIRPEDIAVQVYRNWQDSVSITAQTPTGLVTVEVPGRTATDAPHARLLAYQYRHRWQSVR